MTTISPEAILSGIQGWQGASVESLPGGLTNNTYKVSNGRNSAVLKVDTSARDVALNSRRTEAEIQAVAASAGLAASVIDYGESHILTAFLEGEVWQNKTLDGSAALEELAISLRKLHSLPLVGRVFDAEAAAKRYVQAATVLPGETELLCVDLIAQVGRPQAVACCHNDLVAQNLISTPQLMFLDWEYACDNDPLFDLATVVEHHDLNRDQESLILDAYFGGDGEQWRERVAIYRGAYLALLYLWLSSRRSDMEVALENVEGRLITRYS